MAGIYILIGKTPVQVSDTILWEEEALVGMYPIEQTYTKDSFVSTVFLGMDEDYDGEGPIKLFETLVCGGHYHEYRERYTSWEDAEEGHDKVLEAIRLIEDENEDS